MKNTSFRPLLFIACLVISFLPGVLGSFATMSNIPSWYAELAQPSFTPPNWLFGPVWTLLYAMMGVALYIVVKKGTPRSVVARNFFLAHLMLNAAWSFVFFEKHELLNALGVIVALWIAITTCIFLFAKVDKRAGWLLLPYLGWVTFATCLNYSFWLLNR